MRRQLRFSLLAGLLLATVAKAQPLNIRVIAYLKDSAQSTRSDSLRNAYLSRIAQAYFNHRQEIPAWFDSAHKYQQLSLELARKKGFLHYVDAMQSVEANMYLITGQHAQAVAAIDRMRDSNAIRRLLDYGQHYNGMRKYYSLNQDSALFFYQKAITRCARLKDSGLYSTTYQYLAYYYSRREDTLQARQMAIKSASFRRNNPEFVINLWLSMANAAPLFERNFRFKRYCIDQALALSTRRESARTQSLILLTGKAYQALGDLMDLEGKDSLALATYLHALRLLEEAKDTKNAGIYNRLHYIYYYNGNFDKAMHYAVKALKAAEANDTRNLQLNYLFLGNCCFEMGQYAQAIGYFEQAFASARKYDNIVAGTLVKKMARALIATGRIAESLSFVQQTLKTYKTPTAGDSMLLQEALGICYDALGQFESAATHYQQMATYLPRVDSLHMVAYRYAWAKHFYQSKQYERAISGLTYCIAQPGSYFPRFAVGEAQLMLYRIDSIRGHHEAALQHYLAYRATSDSMYAASQKEQLEALRLQFDLDKKDYALQLSVADINFLTKEKLLQQSLAEQSRTDALFKQQSIDLLTQEANVQNLLSEKQAITLQQQQKELALQKENIELLNGRELAQAARLRQANFIKQLTIGGVVLLLVIVGLLYSRYRNKKKTSRQMSEKNEKLQQLVEEKEWLLKEVHHRVKNNLQVVLSLLQSQSAYLQDDALEAVHISQHRVQAMTLIHQKLYQTDNVATVDMGTYIPELIAYLQDSFADSNHIRFVLNTAPILLDVKQAIPLGLIINEAVTNVFKHAFPDRQRGQLAVSLQWYNQEEIVLDIKDNGIGIQTDANSTRSGSLGMSLMKGLCGDFQARYSIRNDHGTHVQVIFPANQHRT